MTDERNDSGKSQFNPWIAGLRLLMMTIVMLGVLFLAAGKLNWWEAWAYSGMTLVVLFSSRLVLLIKNPALAEERVQAGNKDDVKSWDRFLMPVTALIGPLVSWVVAGLDERFLWSPDLPDGVQIAALGVIFLGSMLGTWAMIINRFFSSHVRIQTDRGQTVVQEGPYRVVRHPGYAGGLISWLAAPVFFSSYWVIIPTVLVMIASVIRTSLEDQTLLTELPGYQEYAQKVKYRVFPGIW
ncbi:MAG: isoprenylcysteine carboxylmethyltransferase family protein [Anaerolineales bacterium]|nr:MAG: isoprenylcysteine carboxylmethyltransferase family protein [Anaerolineales bacterium]